jgi:hypothetical protein
LNAETLGNSHTVCNPQGGFQAYVVSAVCRMVFDGFKWVAKVSDENGENDGVISTA